VPLAVAGDAAAQRLVVEQISRRVRSIALSILSNQSDAEDATQAIFMEVLGSLGTFNGGSLLAWSDSISVRTALRHARQRRIRGAREVVFDADDVAAEPDRMMDARVPRPIIEYLAELPETRRVVLVLRHVLGYSIEEIAELTEASPNTVKDRLLRAREQMRKTLRRELGVVGARRMEGS